MNDIKFIEDIADRILLHVGVENVLGSWTYMPNNDMAFGSPSLVYDGGYYIILLDDEYDLVLGNQEWTTSCLADLEYRLAHYKLCETGVEKWLHL